MDRAQKLDMLKVMTDETDLNVLSVYLDLAAREVCRAAYPFDDSVTTVPDKYAMDHLRVAEYLYAKRKTAGEISHSENGLSVAYESAGVPHSLLKNIVPMCGVVS